MAVDIVSELEMSYYRVCRIDVNKFAWYYGMRIMFMQNANEIIETLIVVVCAV